MASARPNRAHVALAALERAGVVQGLITQNVDRLHHRAGHSDVLELHGTVMTAQCMSCALVTDRSVVQAQMLEANRGWAGLASSTSAASRDSAVEEELGRLPPATN